MKKPSKRGIRQRVREIVPKVEKAGLVDISVGWTDIDWAPHNIGSLIARLAPGSDFYMVGRTFMAWSILARGFAKAVAAKSLRCRMVIANPKLQMRSLVADDQAQGELATVFRTFKSELPIGFAEARNAARSTGFIEIYGIPAFIPEAFTAGTFDDGTHYCCLEIGIAVDPTQRVQFFFERVGEGDVYGRLRRIYENILDRDPRHEVAKRLLRVDAESVPKKQALNRPSVESGRRQRRPKESLIRYFVSFAHADEVWKKKLCELLAQRLASVKGYRFEAWDDGDILPGQDWRKRIDQALTQCQFGLLLVSPAFLASKYIRENELPPFVRGKRAIPVALLSLSPDMDLKGLQNQQIFYYKDAAGRPKSFLHCAGAQRQAFADQLFEQIVKIVKGEA